MPTIKFKPEFEEELIKRKIKCKFLRNLNNSSMPHLKNLSMKDKVIVLNRRHDWEDFITHSFLWTNTPEGIVFWTAVAVRRQLC